MRRPARFLAAVGIGALLASAVPTSAFAGTSSTGSELIERSAELTQTVAGIQPSGDASQQLAAASVTQDTVAKTFSGTIRLKAAATAATDKKVVIAVGMITEGSCRLGSLDYPEVAFGSFSGGPGATVAGDTITFSISDSKYRNALIQCAAVFVDPVTPTDARGGTLVERNVALDLSTSDTKNAKLGKWTKVRVTVANRGDTAAKDVVVRASGTGLAIKGGTVDFGSIAAGTTASKTLRVKVSSKKSRILQVELTAYGTESIDEFTRVVPVYTTAKPVPGRYVGKAGGQKVSFRVTKSGKLTGWRSRLYVTCGVFPSIPTRSLGAYDYPRVNLPKTGRLDVSSKGGKGTAKYTVALRGTFDGKRVHDGSFTYNGPGSCTGTVRWTAKRVGR